MKKINSLILATLLLSLSFCHSVQHIPGSSRGDNAIIIKTNDSAEEAFRRFVQILSFDGYSIDYTDIELGLITSGPKSTSRLNASMKINSSVMDGSITLTGLVSVDASVHLGYGVNATSGWNKVENTGMGGSVMQVAWGDLYSLAKKYPEGEIIFENRQ